jgi:AcrR family transcriptional regulator
MNPDSLNGPSPPRGLRARQREETQLAILQAAAEVFCDEGLEAPMERIARQAEVAVGTLYNHFADRDALIRAVFEHRRREMIARLEACIAATAGQGFRPRLQQFVDDMIIVPADILRFRRLLFSQNVVAFKPKFGESVNELTSLFEGILAQGRAEGALRSDPMNLQPIFLLAVVHVASRKAMDAPEELSPRAAADEVTRQFLDGAST